MAILVSGGAGYIGSHTCIELLNAGFDIVVADNYYNASPVVLDRVKQITGKDFRFYQADMTKHEDVEKIFTECPDIDAVIQFAAYKAVGESVSKPIEYYYNNLNCTLVILDVMRRHAVSPRHFAPTTGYGYDDVGRDTLEALYADLFHTEAAIVRPQIVSGTHTLSLAMFGVLRPGDELLYASGAPYDSLEEVIGLRGDGACSLKEMNVSYAQVEMKDGKLDLAAIRTAMKPNTRMVAVQRSRGYSSRAAFDLETIGKVVQAAKMAQADHFIHTLPGGYQMELNEESSNVSQGQKQLLTIARAMLLDAKMLILDEATSNVDTRTEIQIQAAMRELMKGKTCFVIAHRLSTIQNADRILVVRDGDIVEQGTHGALMAQNGFYASLYNSQFQ